MNREQRRMSKKSNLRGFKPWGRIVALLMIVMLMCGVFAVSSSAVSITDGDIPNHTIKSTAPYNTIGFYTGEEEYKINTFSFPTYITSDNTSNYELKWFEGIKGSVETVISERYRYMDIIQPTYNISINDYVNLDDISDLNNGDYINLYCGNSLVNIREYHIAEIYYTFDSGEYNFDFWDVDKGTLEHVYDNYIIATANNPYRNPNSIYQYWECFYNHQSVTPYAWLDNMYNDGKIDTITHDALWFILDFSSPMDLSVGQPDSVMNWEKLSQEETEEAIYNELKLTIDKNQFSYDGNNVYIILFGENQIRSYADMLNRGEFHFTESDGSALPISVRTVGKFDVLRDAINSNGQYNLNFETINFDISNDYSTGVMPSMPNLADSFWSDFNNETNYINIREIYTYITIKNISTEEINMWLDMIYDKTPAMSENWVISQIGGKTISFNTTHVSLDDVSFVEWLGETVSGFFGTEMFGGVTIGDILWFIIGLSCLFASLKYFSGG